MADKTIYRITRGLLFGRTLDLIQGFLNKCVHINDPITLPPGDTSDPPLLLQDGPLTTTPQSGAVEFNGGHFYYSKAAGVRYAGVLSNGVKTSTTTVTNTVTETELYSKSFAANELHEDEVVEFKISGSFTNASASDDFTLRVKIDGTTEHTISRTGGNETDAGWEVVLRYTVRADGVSGTYVDFYKYAENNGSVYSEAHGGTHSVDTTASHTFSVTVEWDNAKAGNTFYCTQGYVTFYH